MQFGMFEESEKQKHYFIFYSFYVHHTFLPDVVVGVL
jgi:hypothetical protein